MGCGVKVRLVSSLGLFQSTHLWQLVEQVLVVLEPGLDAEPVSGFFPLEPTLADDVDHVLSPLDEPLFDQGTCRPCPLPPPAGGPLSAGEGDELLLREGLPAAVPEDEEPLEGEGARLGGWLACGRGRVEGVEGVLGECRVLVEEGAGGEAVLVDVREGGAGELARQGDSVGGHPSRSRSGNIVLCLSKSRVARDRRVSSASA